ncbi:hypothetical protein WG901_15615 [Novosphingobium sp. PS1R-30]|uniref:Uncharacterized protein n=1 Tax=Novosphingobium anseongense TaxID=3133436 RepID=A0ABU8RZC1_9SPHN|nr:MAG: hypothetical protein EOO76_00010 [Novosphingobium sp.]
MTINFAPEAVQAAASPEEAALVFKEAVARGMAKVMSDALAKALATRSFEGNPRLAGWQTFVQGFHADLAWAKPALESVRALTQIATYSPLDMAAVGDDASAQLLGIEVGVSIRATF